VVPARQRYDTPALLAVAADVFTTRGYDGTSMEDLARAAGLSKSSLYHHVPSKEHLLGLALDRALEPLSAVLATDSARTGPAVTRLEHVVRGVVAVLADRLPYVTLLLRVHGNTATERAALQRRRDFDHAVAGLVAEAAGDGDVRGDLDPGVAARLLLGMVNSLVEWYRPGGPVDAERLAEHVVRLALDGLRAPGTLPTGGVAPAG
jgi:AcrR family transcriptional regulator